MKLLESTSEDYMITCSCERKTAIIFNGRECVSGSAGWQFEKESHGWFCGRKGHFQKEKEELSETVLVWSEQPEEIENMSKWAYGAKMIKEGSRPGKNILKYQSRSGLSIALYDFLAQFADIPIIDQYLFDSWENLIGTAYDNQLVVKTKPAYGKDFHNVKTIAGNLVGYAVNSNEYGIRLVIDSRFNVEGE